MCRKVRGTNITSFFLCDAEDDTYAVQQSIFGHELGFYGPLKGGLKRKIGNDLITSWAQNLRLFGI